MDPPQPFAIQFQPSPQQPPHQPPYSADVHSISAANPTPTFPQPTTPSHPSYSEMITAAIQWENSQGKQGGSSKRAIEKYIDRVYSNLPPTHSALLSHHLKRLKNSGHLVMLKNSYQLPSVVSASAAAAAPTPTFGSVPAQQFPQPAQQPQSQPPQFQPPQFQPPQFQPPQFQQPQYQQQFQAQSTAAVDQSVTPKRKPGRPAKPKHSPAEPVVVPDVDQQVSRPVSPVNGSVKRRGRPPKKQNQDQEKQQQQQQATVTTAEVPFFQPITQAQPVSEVQSVQQPFYVIVDNGEQQSGEKRGRGRPKKQLEAVPQQFQTQPQQEVKEKPVAENGAATVPKRRGRPPREINPNVGVTGGGSSQAIVAMTPRGVGGVAPRGRGPGRGRPRKNVVPGPVSALGPIQTVNVGKKGRGWPKGRPRGKKVVGQAVRVALGLKRRGRPPRGTGGMVRQKRVSRTGKTLGRPRKNALTVGKQASDQGLLMANLELLKKLEDMQLKIRDAVGTIRPFVLNQNAPDALTALHQLEDLSTMQLTGAPTETSPPVVTMPVNVSASPPSTSAPESVAPPPSLNDPPGMMTAPFLFNVPLPSMTVTEPFHAPSIGDSQPMSWIPSSGAQS